jgi:hypothetical protein
MRLTRTTAAGAVLGVGLVATASAAYALSLEPDGVDLRAELPGGVAKVELEDRNTRPAICFIWEAGAPQDGDSIASRILTRAGAEVVDLGSGDQWVDGAGEGCEIPKGDRYRDVFADPGSYVVEFRVVEEQGTPPTGPVRSGPLQRAEG